MEKSDYGVGLNRAEKLEGVDQTIFEVQALLERWGLARGRQHIERSPIKDNSDRSSCVLGSIFSSTRLS